MPRPLPRRAFLTALAGLGAAALRAPAQPAPGRPVFFVPAADYHELPAGCYAENLIPPSELILHWDGNRHGRELWKVAVTYETLAYVQQSAHFAVDNQRVWQLLPMYQQRVQESYGAKGYNKIAVNIELAGRDFDLPDFAPGDNQVRLTLRLVSQLMDFYAIPFEKVVGHYERDDRGLKQDPGVQFLAAFREQLAADRAARTPLKQRFFAEP
ncbi:MAG: N-acetylmuramoyl-L-alanine amidase [Anaerolineales bacterium]|nr:N-acetylmuramoyl-L-alanine amidase [Anaerolineales bacterium]